MLTERSALCQTAEPWFKRARGAVTLPTSDDLPDGLEDLTPAWLTAALREGGHLGADASVCEVKVEPIGDGVGFVGSLARLRLGYAGSAPDAPRSLVAKLPTRVARSRAMAEFGGLYEREHRFYTEFAARLPMRTPRLYFAAMQPGLDAAQLIRRQRRIERLPYVLMALVTLLLVAFTGRFRRRRYVLLLEDLAFAHTTDQVAGCDLPTARQAVQGLARAHAHHWNAPDLRGRGWLPVFDDQPRSILLGFKLSRGAFQKRFGDALDDTQRRWLDWLDRRFLELAVQIRGAPVTYCHGDYRLANLFHEDAGVIALDWQTSVVAPGPYDLAYFLTSSFPNPSEAEIDELKRLYHTTLCEAGVQGYDAASFERDYRRVLPLCLGVLVLIFNTLEQGDPKLEELTRVWLRRLAIHMRGMDPDALLGQ